MLIELVNGGIKDIETDTESYGGCETCDWGSKYINEFKVMLTKGNIFVEVSRMYDHALSEGYMMKLFISNLDEIKTFTEEGFYEWLKNKLETEIKPTVEEFEIRTSLPIEEEL